MGTIAFIVPILTILHQSIEQTLCDAFCSETKSKNKNKHNQKKQKNKNKDKENKFSSVRCVVIAPSTVLSHQIYREFIKYSQGLQVGIYSLDENCCNSDDNGNSLPIHIIISTPAPLAKQIK